jgi:hypothetical protein
MISGSLRVKGWLTVSGILLLGAGASLGFLIASYRDDDARRGDDEADPRPPATDIATSVAAVTNSKVWDLLHLDETQRAHADRILNAHLQKLRHLREEWDQLGQKVEDDLLALLDEGQREQMVGIIRQIKINEIGRRGSDRLVELKRELKLSEKQEDAVYALLLSDLVDRDQYFRSVHARRRSKTNIERGEVMKACEKLNDALREKMKAVLDDGQFCKFREIEKRWQPWGARQGEKSSTPAVPGSSPKAPPPEVRPPATGSGPAPSPAAAPAP